MFYGHHPDRLQLRCLVSLINCYQRGSRALSNRQHNQLYTVHSHCTFRRSSDTLRCTAHRSIQRCSLQGTCKITQKTFHGMQQATTGTMHYPLQCEFPCKFILNCGERNKTGKDTSGFWANSCLPPKKMNLQGSR